MNILKGHIENINQSGSLTIVHIRVKNTRVTAIVINAEEKSNYLKINHPVSVIFKETEVIIGKGKNHQISMQNKFEGSIENIESKELLSKLILETTAGKITSIITTNAVEELKLEKNSEITAMIKTNEIILSE